MSRFLKFIVHLVIICTILDVVALAVPPFVGIKTNVVDDSYTESNLPTGSVTYSQSMQAGEVQPGDAILVQEGTTIYRYQVKELNQEDETYTVENTLTSSGETTVVSSKGTIEKVIITIGYIGYLLVAVQSVEGMIVLGLGILFLIILYVIVELWRKEPKESEEEEEKTEETEELQLSKKERKKREKEQARLAKEESKRERKEEKNRKKEEKKHKKVKTGGFIDEIYEEDLDLEHAPAAEVETPVYEQAAASEAHEELKKEIAAATAEETEEPGQPAAQPVSGETAETSGEVMENEKEAEPEMEETVEIRKMAIPLYSKEELSKKAKAEGDNPVLMEDKELGVTLFDYSEIIAGKKEEE